MREERLRVLRMLAAGRLNAEQAESLLRALGAASDAPSARFPAQTFTRPHTLERARLLWGVPALLGGLGVLFALFGGWGSGFWIVACLRLPLLVLSALVALVGFSLRASTWVHVRVHLSENEWPRRVTVWLPLPLGLLIGLVRLFGWALPLEAASLEGFLQALRDLRREDTPLHVEVQEADGERVEVFVG